MAYRKSIFFIPVRFGDFNNFTRLIKSSNKWETSDPKTYTPRYLLNYAVRIAKSKTLFQSYELKKEQFPDIYTFENDIDISCKPEIYSIRLSCFSTGIGFLEVRVNFGTISVTEISEFSYLFKKSTKKGKNAPEGKMCLYDAALSLMPDNSSAEIFFTAAADFKRECVVFHFLQVEQNEENCMNADHYLDLLKRSYNSKFNSAACSDYDMIYKAYQNDHWGGSSEGIVNISYDPSPEKDDYYLHTLKEEHLEIDYCFMYLLLLNQRFSTINYICEIAECTDADKKAMEIINKKIVKLKTVFSFRIISDDLIFQNVYAKMYQVLDIDSLLEDIRDNENQSELLINMNSEKIEKRSSQFLMGISLLSLFSALIDASSFFDRISFLQPIATYMGTFSTILVVAFCILWLYRNRKH